MEDTSTFPININMYVPPQLHTFMMVFLSFSLIITICTTVFQLMNPKSRRNMGRFFLLILVLQGIEKGCVMLQLFWFPDLSIPYYEIANSVSPKSAETSICQVTGAIRGFTDQLSQFYCLWLAVLIKQILKDPIHRINRYMYCYHIITILLSVIITGVIASVNHYGVEETLQCGMMTTAGFDDEILMLLPFILVPIQLWLVVKIMRQTPFILKRFVAKYILCMFFLMFMQCLQVTLIIYGSRKPNYFTYEGEDGYKRLRYAYLIIDQVSFFLLAVCTLCERVFFDRCIALFNIIFKRKIKVNRRKQLKCQGSERLMAGTVNSIEFENFQSFPSTFPSAVNLSESSDEDNFEEGNNQVRKKDEIDIEDQEKFEMIVNDGDDDEQNEHQTVQQRTNFFVKVKSSFLQIINSVLMSICYSIQAQTKESNVVGKVAGLVKFTHKLLTYQLKDNDLNHILDMAEYYKNHPDQCVGDVTNGKTVHVKITEFGPEMLKSIRRQSGFNDDFLIKQFTQVKLQRSFAPKMNEEGMAKFQEGTGKSASFFFFTSNQQFVIKTLKDEELELLSRKGVLEKYYNYMSRHPKSLLARFYGVYTVKIQYMKPINVIVMDNLMGEHFDQVQRIYDLKGSTFMRITNQPQPKSVRKDLNFLAEEEYRLQVSKELQEDLLQRIQKDKEFLKSCNLMDYSMLIVFFKKSDIDIEEEQNYSIHSNDTPNNRKRASIYLQKSIEGDLEFNEVQQQENEVSPLIVHQNGVIEGNPYDNYQNIRYTQNINGGQLSEQLIENPNPGALQKKETLKSKFVSKANIITKLAKGLKTETKQIASDLTPHQLASLKPKAHEYIQYQHPTDKHVYYRLGIIDFLQRYNKRKQLETKWLQFRNRNIAPDTFSCVHPRLYGDRFHDFMSTNLFDSQHLNNQRRVMDLE